MPEYFSRFIDLLEVAGSRDRLLAARFGGSRLPKQAFVSEWREIVGSVQQALRSREGGARLILVTTPETFSLNEALRARDALQKVKLRITDLVLNRVILQSQPECGVCRARQRAAASARAFLKRHFPGVTLFAGQDVGSPALGVAALQKFGAHVFAKRRLPRPASPPPARGPNFRARSWPQLHTPLTLTLGKGGVGKTTISAAMAFHQRRVKPAEQVVICSTDPAPSLDDVFRQPVSDRAAPVLRDKKFFAAELDAAAGFRAWAQSMQQKVDSALTTARDGVHIDLSFERQLFSALLQAVPPGVDELFSIFRVLDLLSLSRAASQSSKVIIDMAPTGHALELLRMPARMLVWSRLLLKALAAHRRLPLAQDVAVEIARLSQGVRRLAEMLQNKTMAVVLPVMLAEPLPDRETARLLAALEGMHAPAPAIFVNRVLFAKDVGNCARCRMASQWQWATLEGLKKRIGRGRKLLVVRNFPAEVAGQRGLQSMTRELWELAPPTPKLTRRPAATRPGS